MGKNIRVLLPFCGLLVVLVLFAGCLYQDGVGDDVQDNRTVPEKRPGGLQSLEFKNYMGIHDAGDTFMVIGTAQNTGDLPIKSVRLQVDYLDRDRTLLASRIFEEDVIILPGESWDFEFSVTGPGVSDFYSYYITPQRIDVVV